MGPQSPTFLLVMGCRLFLEKERPLPGISELGGQGETFPRKGFSWEPSVAHTQLPAVPTGVGGR